MIGLLILCVAPFCSWTSLLLAGGTATVVLSILVLGSATSADAPIGALIAVNSAPVLAMSAAAAATRSRSSTRRWRGSQRSRGVLQKDAELRTGIARSVQQSRVSVLGREVLPFLASVMTADRISIADADRAGELADVLRRHQGRRVDLARRPRGGDAEVTSHPGHRRRSHRSASTSATTSVRRSPR